MNPFPVRGVGAVSHGFSAVNIMANTLRQWLEQTSGEIVVELSDHVTHCAECGHAPAINPEDMCADGRNLLNRYSLRRLYETLNAQFITDGYDSTEADRRSREKVTVEQIRLHMTHWDALDTDQKHYLALRLMELAAESTAKEAESDGDDGGTEVKAA